MEIFQIILLCSLIVCAIAVAFSRKLLTAIIIFSAYSIIMSVIWILLRSPDLAITEAAVGAGVTGMLFYITLRRIDRIRKDGEEEIGDYEEKDGEAENNEKK